jgi:uncharacterized protein YndB with AHSA1/START domain
MYNEDSGGIFMVQAVVIKKEIEQPLSKVFQAWTNPNIMSHWLYPGEGYTATAEVDLKPKGVWKVDMTYLKDGSVFNHFGQYKEIIPNKKLVFSWNSEIAGKSKVTVDFKDKGDCTKVIIHHENLPTDEARKKHTEGWTLCMDNLDQAFSKEEVKQAQG